MGEGGEAAELIASRRNEDLAARKLPHAPHQGRRSSGGGRVPPPAAPAVAPTTASRAPVAPPGLGGEQWQGARGLYTPALATPVDCWE